MKFFYHVLGLYNFPAESYGIFLSEHYVALSLDSLLNEIYVKTWHGHEHVCDSWSSICRHRTDRHADTQPWCNA